MRYLKMYIAAVAFPTTLLPFLLLISTMFGEPRMLVIPFLHFLPVIWGIWNILYFTGFKKFLPKDTTLRLLITGGALGFLVALYGVFVAHIPWYLGMSGSYGYLPLIIAPILYAIFWLFIVAPLNRLLGVRE